MASNLESKIFSECVRRDGIRRKAAIDTDAEQGERDGRTTTGYKPDRRRIKTGHIPDSLQVAHATLNLTRSVRDGVWTRRTKLNIPKNPLGYKKKRPRRVF